MTDTHETSEARRLRRRHAAAQTVARAVAEGRGDAALSGSETSSRSKPPGDLERLSNGLLVPLRERDGGPPPPRPRRPERPADPRDAVVFVNLSTVFVPSLGEGR